MNREPEQRAITALASISLVVQNFTGASEGKLEERVKRRNRVTVWKCKGSFLFVSERESGSSYM